MSFFFFLCLGHLALVSHFKNDGLVFLESAVGGFEPDCGRIKFLCRFYFFLDFFYNFLLFCSCAQ